jgi:hypothetical protein
MKIDIRDVAAMRSLRPLEVAAYLRAQCWVPQSPVVHCSVWTKGEGPNQFEIVVPMDQERRDYALRMGELLQTLADRKSVVWVGLSSRG